MKAPGSAFINKARLGLRKNKLLYYIKSYLRQIIPTLFYKRLLNKKLLAINKYNSVEILDRVNYYNKLENVTAPGDGAILLKDMEIFERPKTYRFDTFEYTRYFNKYLRANFLFGDVTHVADVPTIQKSRPVAGNNANAVLLNLNKKRHFVFIKDARAFITKKNMIIGRGVVSQPHRARFMEMYFDNPLCNLGQVNKTGGNAKWLKPKLSIADHLAYKFILSLEGNDVATNLKWILASNSIAVMPRPKYETWFMEGRLMPNFHYILIKDDYSDLEERINYYINHTDEALTIIQNANAFVQQFLDKRREDLISLLVLKKYFEYTGQAGGFD